MNVVVSALSHTFPGKPPRPALEDLNFQIPSGQFTALVGPSGCGKSTLLRLAANLLAPSAGQIRLAGQPPAQVVADRRIAWMSQSPGLLPWLNARANVALAGQLASGGQAQPADPSSVVLTPDEALDRVGLLEAAHAYPHMLSGGMQQRLALARTLSLPARLWLMDEPFAALDELTRERLAVELLGLWQRDAHRPTVLWVTHNLHEALRLADRVLVLTAAPGRLAADIHIDLPRPREEGMPGWYEALRCIRSALEAA